MNDAADAPLDAPAARRKPRARAQVVRPLREAPPANGEPVEIVPGIGWLRLPLPYKLDHINVWLLQEIDGWTLIDTGVGTPETRAIWDRVVTGILAGRPLRRLVVTHGHMDHIGLAGWFVERFAVPFQAPLVEWLNARLWRHEATGEPTPEAERYLLRHGCTAAEAHAMAEIRNDVGTRLVPLPPRLDRIRDGHTLRLGGRDWRVITCGGHSAEHASLWCPEEGLLIGGDQILPKISPFVGVWESQPDADPLGDYIASFARFEGMAPGTRVLCSHGLPFTGLPVRIAELRHHHRQRLDLVLAAVTAPRTGRELAAALFPKAIGGEHARMALSETMAHVNHLVVEGRLAAVEEDGVVRYVGV